MTTYTAVVTNQDCNISVREFYKCSVLTSLVFPQGVKKITIGRDAFNGCSGLKSLVFPEVVKKITIGDVAFGRCIGLKSLVFPQVVKNITIGRAAFLDCSGLKSLVFPQVVEEITSGLLSWNEAGITAFFQGLQGARIKTLNLVGPSLCHWNAKQVRALAGGLRKSNITTLNCGPFKENLDFIINKVEGLRGKIHDQLAIEMTDELYTAIEDIDNLSFVLSHLETGTDRLDNDPILNMINSGYTAILSLLFNVNAERPMENLVLLVEYLDKIACISDDDFAFLFANFLAFEPDSKLWFYRLVSKVNLDNSDLRIFCQKMLCDSKPKDVLMTPGEICKEATNQLSGLLKEGLFAAGHKVVFIENYFSEAPLPKKVKGGLEEEGTEGCVANFS